MKIIRSRIKSNASSSRVAEGMIKMLLPSISHIWRCWKITFNTVNANKPCKKDEACEKAFNS